MASRGFPAKFIRWTSHLLSSSTSRIQINGSLSLLFAHNRWLHQGDPISSYLFILAADVLQQMTTAMDANVPYCLTNKIDRSVLTFQYADDTILMVSARGNTIRTLLLVIHCFTLAFGLNVNFSKSSFVPMSIPQQHLQSIRQVLGCKYQSLPITYLGMPLSYKKPSRRDFMTMLQKLEGRLDGWKARFISRAGKLQHVKSVLLSIPTYFMSCFTFPKWLIARIDRIRRDFMWSRPQSAYPIHLLNWQFVCLPIPNGGLGVLNLQLRNTSLLLRWWWRLYATDRKLWHTSWKLSSSGAFSVKSIYRVLSQGGKIRSSICPVWKSKVTPSMRLFFFPLQQNRLLTHDNMQKRHLAHTPGCVMCTHQTDERATHLFFLCPYAVHIWDAISSTLGYTAINATDTPLLVFLSSAPSDREAHTIWMAHLITAMYFIWRERNNRTFRSISTNHHILLERILQEVALCLKYC